MFLLSKMSDWSKESLRDMIQAYKNQPNLYDIKHKLYYNKQARNLSMKKILEAVKKTRPETNANEITKKIQTLRTQFGQEVNKIEKSQSLGEELIYKPKVWWFQHLEWIGNFMKTRSDPTPLSARAKRKSEHESSEPLFEFAEDVDDATENYTTEIELSDAMEYETEPDPPPPKKQKTYPAPKSIRASQVIEKREGVRTIEYTLINEDSREEIVEQLSKEGAEQNQESDFKIEKYKRRSKAFGKYVSALLLDISDDKLFFELQKNITSCIHDACMKQSEKRNS